MEVESAEKKIKITEDEGVIKEIIEEGQGNLPLNGQTVKGKIFVYIEFKFSKSSMI